MDEEARLLAALGERSDDDASRAAYAAWLDARGDARGPLLRLDDALARLPEADPGATAFAAELDALEAAADPGWLARVGLQRHERFDLILTGFPETNRLGVRLHLAMTLGLPLHEQAALAEQLAALPLTLARGLRRREAFDLRERLAFWSPGPFDEAAARREHEATHDDAFDPERARAEHDQRFPVCDVEARLNWPHTWAESLRLALPQPVHREVLGDEVLLEGGSPRLAAISASSAGLVVLLVGYEWRGPHELARAHRPFRRWPSEGPPADRAALSRALHEAIGESIAARRATFRTCRMCGETQPPEWMSSREDVCDSCAERHLGVIH